MVGEDSSFYRLYFVAALRECCDSMSKTCTDETANVCVSKYGEYIPSLIRLGIKSSVHGNRLK